MLFKKTAVQLFLFLGGKGFGCSIFWGKVCFTRSDLKNVNVVQANCNSVVFAGYFSNALVERMEQRIYFFVFSPMMSIS